MAFDDSVDAFVKAYDRALIQLQQKDFMDRQSGTAAGLYDILRILLQSVKTRKIFVDLDPSLPIVANHRFEVQVASKKLEAYPRLRPDPEWLLADGTWSSEVILGPPGSRSLASLHVRMKSTNEISTFKLKMIETLFRIWVQASYEDAVNDRIDGAIEFVLSISDRRFGSIIGAATAQLSRAIRSAAGLFIAVDNVRFQTQYRTTSKRIRGVHICSDPEWNLPELGPARLQLEPFFWDRADDLLPLAGIGSLSTRIREEKTKCLVVPVINDGTTIGWYVAFWLGGHPPLTTHHLSALKSWAAMVATPTRFLFQRSFGKLIVDPIFSSRNTRIAAGKCCVLMPFTEPWSTRIWSRVIRPKLEDLGITAVRADDLFGHDVMEDIWEMINTSEYVIADITGRNANVFYELGIAHTLGKKVILLTQTTADIPFDLNRYRHIIYQDNIDGTDYLGDQLIQKITEMQTLGKAADKTT
ncbi:hypothetical protein [Arthrobacter sp. NPDC058127]|uniref:hypothetical protein n=1 Tax=Arthrobacter sp. NPDC058127 TaxID=3346351 RepID=UPI0036E75E1C